MDILHLKSFLSQLSRYHAADQPLVVALSGGIDSVVLTHLLWRYRQISPTFKLAAVHVHHGLSANADDWLFFCQQLCDQWQIPLFDRHVQVTQGHRLSLEEQARHVRYQVFEQMTGQGYAVVCAHHQDDQAETFLLNLKRGSGCAGLAGMPHCRALGKSTLLRPLLSFSRAQIEAYAERHKLCHIVDESNDDERFDRNYIRHQILPRLNQRWPQFTQQISQSCQWLAQSQQLQGELAEIDLRQYMDAKGRLSEKMSELSSARQVNLLRFWLRQQTGFYPSQYQLQQICQQMQCAPDRAPKIDINEGSLRRFQHFWQWVKPLPSATALIWSYPFAPINLPRMTLSMEAGGQLRSPHINEIVKICFRPDVGTISMRPVGRGGSRTLKKLLQELQIPPWQRDHVPLLFYGEHWVALADQLIDERFIAPETDGRQLNWQFYADTLPSQHDE
ncbi:tRNA lysidine(34) synthetase TilS [Celerinatantimonas yamalensis]|uniref:tRNA(Ile)-lysidine synthase n=1 Tax=Celerinatantimonas yamalensis TaxID=559956 RepID=A0ABW9G865_9GAMM